MFTSRTKTLFKYVTPAILTNACVFLFTIIDGIFVGRGVGSDALGAVNIAMPKYKAVTAGAFQQYRAPANCLVLTKYLCAS